MSLPARISNIEQGTPNIEVREERRMAGHWAIHYFFIRYSLLDIRYSAPFLHRHKAGGDLLLIRTIGKKDPS
jgi:hypothetical protein